jgi:long-chain acyl-CoA synthetase
VNLGTLLTAAATHHPERVALVWDEGRQRRTYRDLNDRADALAAGLVAELGIGPGDRVAVLMWNEPELLELMFATWKAGATVAPLNARCSPDEIAFHVADTEPTAFVAGPEFVGKVADHVTAPLTLEALAALRDRHLGEQPPTPDVTDDDVAWLAYTSGTTGRPKGAMLTHRNLTFVALTWLADLQHLEPEDVGLLAAPLTHGAGIMALAFVMKGCTQVLLQPSGFDAGRFIRTIESEQVTHTWLVPTQIKTVLDDPALDRADLSSLKSIVYGASPMYVEDLREAHKRIGPVFVQLFGQTESPMTGTYLRAAEHVLDGPHAERLTSCGYARSAMEVLVLGPDDEPVPTGEIGEICLRGPAVMKGYWRQPEATAETLRNGWLHTGDLGRMDEQGFVYILDRSKDMYISGGLNVYPREVEEVLLRHPAITEVAVVGVPDDRWGEVGKALVVTRDGSSVSPEEVVELAGQHLASYKKPKSVDFLDALPKTPYGKVDKLALRAPYWAGRARRV